LGDLQQLRADITSLEQQLAAEQTTVKDLTTKNSQYKVDLNWANAQFENLKNEIAKEREERFLSETTPETDKNTAYRTHRHNHQ
jgi:predicted  nucleic acid-binding Zn-ribbon protein